ncbi:TetR/AcrR family transcriptional regulator [Sinomonas sp. ASV486]|uniref:TetR/AcrR family transcriptional regulator n=1 Tax=Sinomonas puerhi TaxID=3238584 RepID=A0AB39L356_9MICC|nr:TetR/AcrR family transcriptional regulator [Sinomonas sp. ASV486]MDQ4488984.1 TetR/AcrR family transcriptional regulator [Sinomonas sp. ASV486]
MATTVRDRYRTEMREAIRQAAERQLREDGPGGVSLAAIARELGMSGPALYRYVPSRDALLTELISDAYLDLARALRDAVERTHDGGDRLGALLTGYRTWARQEPHRYRLLFQPPLPDFDSNATSLVEASRAPMRVLLEVLTAKPAKGAGAVLTDALRAQLEDWARGHGPSADAEAALAAVTIWSRLHGFVSLEIANDLTAMGVDADELFAIEARRMRP